MHDAAQGDSGKRLTRYRLVLQPKLAWLAQRTNQRIYQQLTVPQIIAQILEEHGILGGAYRFQLGPTVYHRADYQLAEGRSDQPKLLSGHLLEISDHPRREWNDLWLLHEVIHQGKQPQVLEESISNFLGGHREQADDDFHQGYRNHFSASPWHIL
ncbi:hypothetical protein D3C78_1547440 [compost metagenome]